MGLRTQPGEPAGSGTGGDPGEPDVGRQVWLVRDRGGLLGHVVECVGRQPPPERRGSRVLVLERHRPGPGMTPEHLPGERGGDATTPRRPGHEELPHQPLVASEATHQREAARQVAEASEVRDPVAPSTVGVRAEPAPEEPRGIRRAVPELGEVVLVFLAVLPLVTSAIVVALWGMGGSGSNK